MFIESNPSPVKYAAKLLGLCEDDVRLPLVKVTEPTKEAVKKALVSANYFNEQKNQSWFKNYLLK